MKNTLLILCLMMLFSCGKKSTETTGIPEHFKHVDQVLWVVVDLDNTIAQWARLGFEQVMDMGKIGDNLLGKPVAEKLIVFSRADVFKRQDDDGLLRFRRARPGEPGGLEVA